nr:MerR family transcriptional regulator [Deltaproteobacteria bacterium]
MRIGELERALGVTRDQVHHYVELGLVPAPEKSAATLAWYGPEHQAAVARVRAIRDAGGSLSQAQRWLSGPLAHAGPEDCATLTRWVIGDRAGGALEAGRTRPATARGGGGDDRRRAREDRSRRAGLRRRARSDAVAGRARGALGRARGAGEGDRRWGGAGGCGEREAGALAADRVGEGGGRRAAGGGARPGALGRRARSARGARQARGDGARADGAAA